MSTQLINEIRKKSGVSEPAVLRVLAAMEEITPPNLARVTAEAATILEKQAEAEDLDPVGEGETPNAELQNEDKSEEE